MAKGQRKQVEAAELENEMMEREVTAPNDNPFAKKHYQEWRVEMVNGQPNKLKIMRERVMITDQDAATLNEGVAEGKLNQYASMYYPA